MGIRRYLFKREALAGITADIAQVLFAGMFIEEYLQSNVRPSIMIFGLALSLSFWIISLRFANR